jgi:hypothetical protein
MRRGSRCHLSRALPICWGNYSFGDGIPLLHFNIPALREPASRSLDLRKTHEKDKTMLIVLIVLILLFGFGGYRMGPGIGYYGGGGISLILLIVVILLLLKVI